MTTTEYRAICKNKVYFYVFYMLYRFLCLFKPHVMVVMITFVMTNLFNHQTSIDTGVGGVSKCEITAAQTFGSKKSVIFFKYLKYADSFPHVEKLRHYRSPW